MAQDITEPKDEARLLNAGRWTEATLTLLILATIMIFLVATFGETSAFAQASSGRGPFFFPRMVLVILLAMMPAVVVGLRRQAQPLPPMKPMNRMLLLIVATGIYCGLIGLLGFLIASVLFAFAVPLLLGRRDFLLLVTIALIYGVAVWLLFEKLFQIILPASPWPIGF